jgi:hypothetical protein
MFSRFLVVFLLLQFDLSIGIIDRVNKTNFNVLGAMLKVYDITVNGAIGIHFQNTFQNTILLYVKRNGYVSTSNYDFIESVPYSSTTTIHLTPEHFYQIGVECDGSYCEWEYHSYTISTTYLDDFDKHTISISRTGTYMFLKEKTNSDVNSILFYSTPQCIKNTLIYGKKVQEGNPWPLYGTMEDYRNEASKIGGYTALNDNPAITNDIDDDQWIFILIPYFSDTSCKFDVYLNEYHIFWELIDSHSGKVATNNWNGYYIDLT